MSATSLPAGFEALEPFVADWAIRGMAARAQARLDSCEAERVAFFEAVKELAAPALARLDQKPLSQLDASETRLMDLMLSFAHVALAVEMQAEDEPKHAKAAPLMRITRATADAGP
jgi:hypothetical protein